MKKPLFNIFSLVTLLLTLSTLTVFAQAKRTLRATIPFNFVANEQVYPAGDYTIEPVYLAGSQSLKLQSADGHLTTFLPTRAVPLTASETSVRLVFNKFAEQYVLSAVCGIEERIANKISAANRQMKLAKRIEKSIKETLSVTAQRR